MTRFYSEALGKHDRSMFSSGNERIDAYFRTTVSQDVKRNCAQCYVLVERETNRLAGFYALSATSIPLTGIPAELARKLPRYPSVPAAFISWLGCDLGFGGQEIGSMLLSDAVVRVLASNIGVCVLCADAIDETAVDFCRGFLFTPFESRPKSLVLPMATALQVIGK